MWHISHNPVKAREYNVAVFADKVNENRSIVSSTRGAKTLVRSMFGHLTPLDQEKRIY